MLCIVASLVLNVHLLGTERHVENEEAGLVSLIGALYDRVFSRAHVHVPHNLVVGFVTFALLDRSAR